MLGREPPVQNHDLWALPPTKRSRLPMAASGPSGRSRPTTGTAEVGRKLPGARSTCLGTKLPFPAATSMTAFDTNCHSDATAATCGSHIRKGLASTNCTQHLTSTSAVRGNRMGEATTRLGGGHGRRGKAIVRVARLVSRSPLPLQLPHLCVSAAAHQRRLSKSITSLTLDVRPLPCNWYYQ